MRSLTLKTGPAGMLAVLVGFLLFAASDAAANDIRRTTIIFNTDFTSAGTGGMRGTGTQTITLGGISGQVTKAYLYWHGPTNSSSPTANATVTVNGANVTGDNIGFSNNNCWGFENSQAYRADVTTLVAAAGNGTYTLTNFIKPGGVEVNGASLLVFFDDTDDGNDRDIVLFDGNDSNIDNSFDAPGWNVSLPGINYASGEARLQLHVSDGQNFPDDALKLNMTVLVPEGPVFQGTLGPATQNGSLWDINTYDVTSAFSPGPNTLSLSTGVTNDCLSLIVAVIDLPAGAAPCNSKATPLVEVISDYAECGPAGLRTPIWGRFGRRPELLSDAGEKLYLQCVPSSNGNYFALWYNPPQSTDSYRVGKCPFGGGCNSSYFIHSGDADGNGQPDCFGRTFWRSRDYGANDIRNPWTKEDPEDPLGLDHAITIFDVANMNLTKKNYRFKYNVGPPVETCVNPNPRPEGELLKVQNVDPPVGPQTEAFFDEVVRLMGLNPPDRPMTESPVSLADLNADGLRDGRDLQIFRSAFGACAGQPRYNPDADYDEDDCTTFADYQVFIQILNSYPLTADRRPPSVTSPADVSAGADPGVCSARLNLGTATATDNVDGSLTPEAFRSDGLPLTDPYPVGTTTITWVATDNSGNSAFADQRVMVSDAGALAINGLSVDRTTLWPPNHKMVPVTLSYNVVAGCEAGAITRMLSVSSNEPVNGTGDGDTAPDWVIVDERHVLLRAERSGRGGGRIYTIVIQATDSKGHTVSRAVTVRVPHDR